MLVIVCLVPCPDASFLHGTALIRKLAAGKGTKQTTPSNAAASTMAAQGRLFVLLALAGTSMLQQEKKKQRVINIQAVEAGTIHKAVLC